MVVSIWAARIFALSACVFCNPAHANAEASDLLMALRIYAGGIPTNPTADVARENKPDLHVPLQLLAFTTHSTTDDRGGAPIATLRDQLIITPPNEVLEKWVELQSRILSEEATLGACYVGESHCPAAARLFLDIIKLGRQHQGRARLAEINRAVNLSIKPISDWAQHGVPDFWSAPLATLDAGAGDCEDYAIVKYVALRKSGIAPDDLHILIVRDIKREIDHAVVAARHDQEWLILDNRTLVITSARDIRNYLPLFVLNERGVRALEAVALRR